MYAKYMLKKMADNKNTLDSIVMVVHKVLVMGPMYASD